MKIIFLGYNTCCQNQTGGVQNRLRKIAMLIQEHGFEIELFNPFSTKLEFGDILHVFKLTLESYAIIKYAKSKGIKVVMSTIIPLINHKKLQLYNIINFLPIVTSHKLCRIILENVDFIITESEQESLFIRKYFKIKTSNILDIPNGTDVDDYRGEDVYGKLRSKSKYILQVGRFDENKNQINVIRAMKDTEITVVFIGGPGEGCETYYNDCITASEGSSNIHFFGWVDNDSLLLKSAYAHADTVVVPSYYETFGLSAIEGACRGAKLVLSETIPLSKAPIFEECTKINPYDISDIKNKIMTTYNEAKNIQFTNQVILNYSWESVIEQHIAIYNKIVNE